MKRDLDLARQLLLDIENRGTDCSVSVLRSGSNHQSEEQVRYHLRLLIDAGLLKEIDRTSAGIPCVRLTYDGHELLELARSDSRWREAKATCQERLGGLSLTVIRGILFRWAISATRNPRYQRAPIARRLRYESDLPRDRPAYRVEPYRSGERLIDRDFWDEDVHYVNVRPEYDEYRDRYARNGYDTRVAVDLDGDGRVDAELDATMPGYLI
ncbi:MAG: DUF2513 domain-containing protein [Bythopirellula sp.]